MILEVYIYPGELFQLDPCLVLSSDDGQSVLTRKRGVEEWGASSRKTLPGVFHSKEAVSWMLDGDVRSSSA